MSCVMEISVHIYDVTVTGSLKAFFLCTLRHHQVHTFILVKTDFHPDSRSPPKQFITEETQVCHVRVAMMQNNPGLTSQIAGSFTF